MKAFEYASPRTVAEAVRLLGSRWGETEVLGGGTDLLALMKRYVLTPRRLVSLRGIPELRSIQETDDGLLIGATTTLADLLRWGKQAHETSGTGVPPVSHATRGTGLPPVSHGKGGTGVSPVSALPPALEHALRGIKSMQLRNASTVAGELCHRPRCWYFRGGHGLLAMRNGRSLVPGGDNRYHAIFANGGPAYFVSASRLAPALIALDAQIRVAGPDPEQEGWMPLEYLYVTPRSDSQREIALAPNQVITHVLIPPAHTPSPLVGEGRGGGADRLLSATYDVLQLRGLDWPLASAAVALRHSGGVVCEARVVLGQVAPTPWVSAEAARALVGRPITPETAQAAGDAAVSRATPLSGNAYKVQLARTAVKRAVLRSAGLLEGGL